MKILALLLLAAPAFAQTPTPKAPEPQVIEFENDIVEGKFVVPETAWTDGRNTSKHPSLVKVRTDFRRELVRSVEDI